MNESKEIERSWLIDSLPPKELIYNTSSHYIAYLFSDKFGEMRIINFGNLKDPKYQIGVKNKGTLVRQEWDSNYVPRWVYDILEWNCYCGINKVRHLIKYNDYTFEIDEYKWRLYRPDIKKGNHVPRYDNTLKGKLKLECEFSSVEEAEEFKLPQWIHNPIEVTYKSEYKNCEIAEKGWPTQNES